MKVSPSTESMQEAIAGFLIAAGLDPEDEDLVDTPGRVASLWIDEFLGGYHLDPDEIMAGAMEAGKDADSELVVLRGLSFHSMCPHHLVPSQGQAHVAYLPDQRLLGLGQIAKLVACFTQRLTLQERATRQIADCLLRLPARGAACVLQARHLCLSIPGDRHSDSSMLTSAFSGELAERPELQQQVLASCGVGVESPGEAGRKPRPKESS